MCSCSWRNKLKTFFSWTPLYLVMENNPSKEGGLTKFKKQRAKSLIALYRWASRPKYTLYPDLLGIKTDKQKEYKLISIFHHKVMKSKR